MLSLLDNESIVDMCRPLPTNQSLKTPSCGIVQSVSLIPTS